MEPGGETSCAFGDPFSYFVRPGTVNRVVIDFRGGGACWDAASCASGLFDDKVTLDPWIADERSATGIYDHAHPDNPFKDWHHVYIPYCTGDIHWGDKDTTYGEGDSAITVRHRGAVNARAALAWVYDNIPDPEKVLVTGCSAGGYGSIMWSAHVREHYQSAAVSQFSDSGAGVIAEGFFALTDAVWGAGESYPTWIPGLDPRSITRLSEIYAGVGRQYADMRLSQYNTMYDDVQTFYFQAMGGDPAAWSDVMKASVAEIEEKTPNFSAYLAPGSEHCILARPELYTVASDGAPLVEWLDALVNGDMPESVACDGAGCGAPP